MAEEGVEEEEEDGFSEDVEANDLLDAAWKRILYCD